MVFTLQLTSKYAVQLNEEIDKAVDLESKLDFFDIIGDQYLPLCNIDSGALDTALGQLRDNKQAMKAIFKKIAASDDTLQLIQNINQYFDDIYTPEKKSQKTLPEYFNALKEIPTQQDNIDERHRFFSKQRTRETCLPIARGSGHLCIGIVSLVCIAMSVISLLLTTLGTFAMGTYLIVIDDYDTVTNAQGEHIQEFSSMKSFAASVGLMVICIGTIASAVIGLAIICSCWECLKNQINTSISGVRHELGQLNDSVIDFSILDNEERSLFLEYFKALDVLIIAIKDAKVKGAHSSATEAEIEIDRTYVNYSNEI